MSAFTMSTRRSTRRLTALGSLLVAAPVLAACTSNEKADPGDPRTITIASTDDACEVSRADAPAGTLTFRVSNEGSRVTEFYLLGSDGLRIVGEVENIGPGAERQLTVVAPAGDYVTACKPGMRGDGIRADFTVDKSDDKVDAADGNEQKLIDTAQTNYAAYVQDQSDQLVVKTRKFVKLYKAGDDDAARDLYPVARTHWERIETVAESFGTLDPQMDAREADLEPGQKWTGWHRIEKDLWPARAKNYTPLTMKQRGDFADNLMRNTNKLDGKIQDLDFTIDQIANGSRGLLEEVATGKVTGEEEYWSRTDLWDFQANVDGARIGYEGVEPILRGKDADLADQLTQRFTDLQDLLDAQREGDGFVLYNELSKSEVKELSDAVNSLSEPLSKLTAAVLG